MYVSDCELICILSARRWQKPQENFQVGVQAEGLELENTGFESWPLPLGNKLWTKYLDPRGLKILIYVMFLNKTFLATLLLKIKWNRLYIRDLSPRIRSSNELPSNPTLLIELRNPFRGPISFHFFLDYLNRTSISIFKLNFKFCLIMA